MLDAATDEGVECGRITVWEPGVRLVFEYRDEGHEIDGTEVEVRFEEIRGGTRVTLEHRGWGAVPSNVAARRRNLMRWDWANVINRYGEWAFSGSPSRRGR